MYVGELKDTLKKIVAFSIICEKPITNQQRDKLGDIYKNANRIYA